MNPCKVVTLQAATDCLSQTEQQHFLFSQNEFGINLLKHAKSGSSEKVK